MTSRYDRQRLSDHDKGEFRVTLVMQTGECSTKKFLSWKKALPVFMAAEKNNEFIFGIIRQCEGDESGVYRKMPQSFSRELVYSYPERTQG